MQCATCGHSNPADASFCSKCGAALTNTCPDGHENPADASFCSKCGARLDEGDEPAADADLVRYVPAELLEKLRAARQGRTMAGERRTVTMLFADVQGSTAAAERLDPEEWAEIINGAFERLIRPVYRFEGTLARLMGDAVLAFFGAPIAHEDDPERAVRAGLAMLREIRPYKAEIAARWGVDFDIRIGVNTGLVVVGEVGSDLRVEYTAIGDAINVAARMEQSAAPGTILIAAATERLVDGLFEVEALDPIAVKGKSEPVAAFRVVGSRDRPSSTRGVLGRETPLVGRDAELATLRRIADEVRAGRGAIVSVIGDAGVGKSRLIDALRDDLAGRECLAPWLGEVGDGRVRWAEARCLSYNTAIAYSPFIDLFTRGFGLVPDDTPAMAWERVLGAVAGSGVDESVRVAVYLCALLGIDPPQEDEGAAAPDAVPGKRELAGAQPGLVQSIAGLPAPTLQKRIFGAVIDYLRACAAAGPIILVFEDLHWGDSVSLALLEELLAATDRSSLGVVALLRPYRDDASWRFHETAQRSFAHRYTPITLGPLDVGATRSLLHGLVEDLAPEVEEVVLERAEGNPFFIEELVRGLAEGGASATGLPDNVSALLTSRIDHLDSFSKLAVQLASVLGRQFALPELAALVGDAEATEDALSDLLSRDLIVESSRMPEREYAFRHALIQETAYSTILLKERRLLHAQVASHLETRRFDPQEMARHLIESQQETRAVPHLVAAGEQAMRAMNLADAIRLFDRALVWVGDEAALAVRAHDGLGAAYSLIPDLTRASSSYQEMLAFGRDRDQPSIQVTALNRLGTATAFLSGDISKATAFLEQARAIAEESGDEMGLAEYHMNSCMIATHTGDLEAAAGHDAETARLGSSMGSERVRLGGLLQRAQSLIYATRFDEGRVAWEHAKREAASATDPEVRANLAASEMLLRLRDGDVAGAWEIARETAAMATAIGSASASVHGIYAGMIATSLGNLEDALAHYAEAVRLGEELGQDFNAAAAAASMVRLYAQLDVDDEEVAVLRAQAVDLAGSPAGAMLSSIVDAELGWAALERGDPGTAAGHFADGLDGSSAAKHLETPALLLGQAMCRIAAGDLDGAVGDIDRAAGFVEARGMAFVRPAVALARGTAALAGGDAAGAAVILDEGAGLAAGMGMSDLLWRLNALHGGALRALGDTAGASAVDAAAEAVIADLGTRFADPSAREAFLAAAAVRREALSSGAPAPDRKQGRSG